METVFHTQTVVYQTQLVDVSDLTFETFQT
jgi:hypothetical protein